MQLEELVLRVAMVDIFANKADSGSDTKTHRLTEP